MKNKIKDLTEAIVKTPVKKRIILNLQNKIYTELLIIYKSLL